MTWQPHKVEYYTDFGSANMGDADDDENIKARFGGNPFTRWSLLFVRCHFAGPGSGTADAAIVLRSRHGETYNTVLFTVTGVGIGSDLFFRVPRDELDHWTFEPDDQVVIEWTNPDGTDDVQWGLEAGIVLADE